MAPDIAAVRRTALSTNSFTKTGYTFSGWNTAANGTGTAYADAAQPTPSPPNVTLFAQWSANPSVTRSPSTATPRTSGSMAPETEQRRPPL